MIAAWAVALGTDELFIGYSHGLVHNSENMISYQDGLGYSFKEPMIQMVNILHWNHMKTLDTMEYEYNSILN